LNSLDESSKSHDIFYSITVCTRDERCAYSCEIVTLLEVPGNICVDVAGLSKPTSELNENSNYKLPYDGQDQNIRRDRTASFKGPEPETNDDGEIQLSSLMLPRTQKHSNVDKALPSGTITPTSPDLSSNASTTQTENYREWYDELEPPAHTPTPSSLGSSISTTGASFSASPYPYPLPNRQFYPSPWMHPFMPQPPYHVPYYGSYPIYPGAVQNPTQSLTSAPGSDASGPAVVPHWPHLGMYGVSLRVQLVN
jgi:hypothetical protein